MKTIGIRQLRQEASKVLQRVSSGETFEITDRGRPVALLIPLAAGTPLQRLETEGRIDPAGPDLLALGPPLPLDETHPLPSEALARARQEER